MDDRHNRKITDRPYFKLLMVPIIALLAFLAVIMGVQAGDILYRLDANLIEKMDTETFRDTINLSLPIIENVYNNGKSSTSLSGEVKNLFARIFEFDLDSPMTILNVQSPLFMSYYKNEYKVQLSMDDSGQKAGVQKDPGTDGETGTVREPSGTGDNTDIDQGGKSNTEEGTAPGNGNETALGPDNRDGTGDVTGDGPGGNTENGTGTGKAPENSGNPIDLQPVSSISYEEPEDDEENNDSDLVASEKVVVRNYTKHRIDIAQLLREPLKLKFDKKGPKVLIYHTHTSESYVLREQDLGKKNAASFNTNPKYSVVRVGEELSRYLKKYGIDTLHNATVHDKVRNAAYGVAINTLQSYKKSYPSIKLYIDVHRDGLDPSKPKLRVAKKINGKNAAQVMFIVGTDDQLPNPNWKENLKFILKVQQKLNEKYPGLARPVMLVGKRYNQQVVNPSVLIEIGGDGNLLSECIESTRYVAEALNDVMKGK